MMGSQQFIYMTSSYIVNIGILIFLPFYLLKYRGQRTIVGFIGTVIGCYVFLLFAGSMYGENSPFRLIINIIFLFAVSFLLFKDSVKRKLTIWAIECLVNIISEISATFLIYIVNPAKYVEMVSNDSILLEGLVLVSMITFIFNMIIAVLWNRYIAKKPFTGYAIFIAVPLYYATFILVFFKIEYQHIIQTAIFGIVLNVVLMYMIQNLKTKMQVEEDLAGLYRQRQYELEYYKITQNHLEQMREARHEYLNQMQTAYMMIQSGNSNEKAKLLLAESYKQLVDAKLIVYCDDPVVNAVVSVKAAKAKDNGVNFQVESEKVEMNGMEAIDICSLISNMLDNSLEACLRIPEHMDRHLTLTIVVKGGYQIIKTENTYYNKEHEPNFWRTSKKDRMNHGYGMKLIERICKKYKGELRTQIKGEIVYVTAYLDLDCIKGD